MAVPVRLHWSVAVTVICVVPFAIATGDRETVQIRVEVPQVLGDIEIPEAERTAVLLDVAETVSG